MNGMIIEVLIYKYCILSIKSSIFLELSSSIWDVSLKMTGMFGHHSHLTIFGLPTFLYERFDGYFFNLYLIH